MKTRALKSCLSGLVVACSAISSHASLIGDTVQMSFNAPTASAIFNGPFDVVVEAGTSDATEVYLPGEDWFLVDVEADSFSVVANRFHNWTAGDFIGLIINDMDWIGAPGTITGLNIDTNLAGFDNSRVSFTTDSVSINWQGLSYAAGTRWDIGLETTHSAAVPEPGSLALLALGMTGLYLNRRVK